VEYPKASRGSFFAHKFVRLLMKSCAAQDMGQNAVLLCVFIAHTEDAMHYSGACRFWNEQLLSVMGFRSAKQLDAARDKAVEAGWLVYDRAGNRSVGRYWVTIPEQFATLTDSPTGENGPAASGNHSAIHSTNHSESDPNTARIRHESGTNQGVSSNPVPDPVPVPQKKHTHGKPDQSTGTQGQPYIPEKVNTPECLQAFEQWCDYLTVAGLDTINPRLNGIQAQAVWQQASRIGPERWPDAVSHSIANGYKSIINRTEAPGRKTSKDKPKGPTLEFLKAVNVCREYPSASDYDREKRETLLGPDVMRIVRKIGTPRLAECDRFTQIGLAAEWEIHQESMK
jgi:hypothetical protein